MRTVKTELSKLEKRLSVVEQNLFEISKTTATTKETSNLFWSRLLSQANREYEKARVIYAEWNKLNIPFFYDKNLRKQIKSIKEMKFKPPEMVSWIKFKDNNVNVQTKASIVSTSVSDYVIGLDSGQKKLNRLFRSTQQLNITENELNKSITDGFNEKRSFYGTKKRLQEVLLQDALDKKYIVVIDKNGKPINYKVTSYAETVARTKLTESQSAGTVNLATAVGSDLVQVSSHNTKTPFDAQFEGKVYSLSGTDPDFPPATFLPPFHPNCIHTITIYFKEAQPEKTLKEMSDFSKGKTETHPTRKSHVPITERT
jgi:hypothetical protein